MRQILTFWVLFLVVFITSCKKIVPKSENGNTTVVTTTFPNTFSWAMSRNIKVTFKVTDLQFGNLSHLINVYNGDPSAGGILLCKGSASVKNPFISTIYLDKKYTVLYVVKTSPNDAKSVQLIDVGATDILATFGARINSPLLKTDNIPSRFVF